MFKSVTWISSPATAVRQVVAKLKSHFWGPITWISKRPSPNDKGFVLIFMSLVLGLSLLTALTLGSSLVLMRNKMQMVHQCRTDLLKTQKDVKPLLDKLLSLNPLAKSLRLQRTRVEAQLALAMASLNKPLIATLTLQRRAILAQQRNLDRYQKFLIGEANRLMMTGTLTAHGQLRERLHHLNQRQTQWGHSKNQILAPKISTLAVKPSDRRMAPTYEPKKDFEKQQALSLFWIQQIELQGLLKIHAFENSRIKSQCHVTLEEKIWVPKIRKDKRF